eukprot:4305329-Pleurochrysis_carterae.AAC.2
MSVSSCLEPMRQHAVAGDVADGRSKDLPSDSFVVLCQTLQESFVKLCNGGSTSTSKKGYPSGRKILCQTLQRAWPLKAAFVSLCIAVARR